MRQSGAAAIGLNDYIDMRRLLERLSDLGHESQRQSLRSAISSLISTSKQEWDSIWQISEILVKSSPSDQKYDSVPPAPEEPPIKQNTREFASYYLIVAFIVLVSFLLVYCYIYYPSALNKPGPIANASADYTDFIRAKWHREFIFDPVSYAVSPPVTPAERHASDYLIGATGALTAALGLGWLLLCKRFAARRQTEARDLRERGRERREALSREAEVLGSPRRLEYSVKQVAPMTFDAIVDSATDLARVFGRVATTDLDIDRTIKASVAEGGRFHPVESHKRTRRHLVVLVDREKGDHPWQRDVDWLLENWNNLGVDLERYDFESDPYFLLSSMGFPVTIDALARRCEGESLLLVSRKIATRDMAGRPAAWLSQIDAWPIRALLDPAPVATSRLPRSYRSDVMWLERQGFPRFSLSEGGVRILAAHLSGGVARQAESGSVAVSPDVAVQDAIKRLALFAALVPDPSWAQLQVVRASTPEIARSLPTNRDLQSLLDWAEQANGSRSAESGDGRSLSLDPARSEELILSSRSNERDLVALERTEFKFRRMLLEQLGASRPANQLMAEFWSLKKAEHLLVLSPDGALPLLSGLIGGAWHEEMQETLQTTIARDDQVPMLPRAIKDALKLVLDEDGRLIPVRYLLDIKPLRLFGTASLIVATAIGAADIAAKWVEPPVPRVAITLPRDSKYRPQEVVPSPDDEDSGGSGDATINTTTRLAPQSDPDPIRDRTRVVDPTGANAKTYGALQPLYCEYAEACTLNAAVSAQIRVAVIEPFDRNRSALIDTEGELESIDCNTLETIFGAIESYGRTITPLQIKSGFLEKYGFSASISGLLATRRTYCAKSGNGSPNR